LDIDKQREGGLVALPGLGLENSDMLYNNGKCRETIFFYISLSKIIYIFFNNQDSSLQDDSLMSPTASTKPSISSIKIESNTMSSHHAALLSPNSSNQHQSALIKKQESLIPGLDFDEKRKVIKKKRNK
jgi:hypothetical protein